MKRRRAPHRITTRSYVREARMSRPTQAGDGGCRAMDTTTVRRRGSQAAGIMGTRSIAQRGIARAVSCQHEPHHAGRLRSDVHPLRLASRRSSASQRARVLRPPSCALGRGPSGHDAVRRHRARRGRAAPARSDRPRAQAGRPRHARSRTRGTRGAPRGHRRRAAAQLGVGPRVRDGRVVRRALSHLGLEPRAAASLQRRRAPGLPS